MKVALVSTYELGRQPFGLASPAAWLRERGHAVEAVDLAISPFPIKKLADAGAVAFYLPMHTAARLAVPAIERLRRLNPAARIIAYGLYAPLNRDYLLSLGVEAVVGGEFEPGLVAAIEGQPSSLISLERLPFRVPDRSRLPALDHYAQVRVGSETRVTGYTEASRGCKHQCRHCPVVPVYQGTFRVVPQEVVQADIRQQVAAGARHITFGDPDFLNGPVHATRIVEALHAEFPGLTYDVTIKVEHLLTHAALLPVLRDTGCLWVTSAVESTEDLVLEKLDKGHTRAGFLRAVELMRAAKLPLAPTFVAFTPWTTLSGYRDLLAVLRDHDLVDAVAPVQLALRLLIPAQSRLLELPDLAQYLAPFEPGALLHRWQHPDSRLDRLAHAIFTSVIHEQRGGTPRRELFAKIWELAYGLRPDDFDLMPRATIPYLNEPWYC
jgi:radical SAM superfamily enzyme YgiQ (UPF0313 family)